MLGECLPLVRRLPVLVAKDASCWADVCAEALEAERFELLLGDSDVRSQHRRRLISDSKSGEKDRSLTSGDPDKAEHARPAAGKPSPKVEVLRVLSMTRTSKD
jgi:hypothetical protein